jgi:hypothetical protein
MLLHGKSHGKPVCMFVIIIKNPQFAQGPNKEKCFDRPLLLSRVKTQGENPG